MILSPLHHEVPDPRDYAPALFLKHAKSVGIAERNVRRLLGSVIGEGEYEPGVWRERGIIQKDLQSDPLHALTLEQVKRSETDGFTKLLFRTADQLPLETVIIPLKKEGMVTLCLSSQVGCVMACAFCATGRMTSRRNLQTWEIVDQFIQARRLARESGKRVTGAVFMGMGEPFLNYDRVLSAAELLCYPVVNAISAQAITISTVGLVSEIDRFSKENRPFRLSISLGAATDEKRKLLVPVASRTPVREVMAAARRHALSRNDRVNIAYVCVGGVNTGVEDAKALGELIGDTQVRLDLIDVNDSTGRFRPPTTEELATFRDALNQFVKQPVVRRYSGGADINAACGTLAGE